MVTSLWPQTIKTQHLVVYEVTFKTSMFTTCSYAINQIRSLGQFRYKRGENFNLLPLLLKLIKQDLSYLRITLPHSLINYLL
jgi:hypothetical protein